MTEEVRVGAGTGEGIYQVSRVVYSKTSTYKKKKKKSGNVISDLTPAFIELRAQSGATRSLGKFLIQGLCMLESQFSAIDSPQRSLDGIVLR